MRIETGDGNVYTSECLQLSGIQSPTDLKDKFLDCAVSVLGREGSETTLKALHHLKDLSNISVLMKLLCE